MTCDVGGEQAERVGFYEGVEGGDVQFGVDGSDVHSFERRRERGREWELERERKERKEGALDELSAWAFELRRVIGS